MQTPQGCANVFDVLTFTDPVVANTVIDQIGIEAILLLPNDDVAINLMSTTETVPRNCKYGMTLRGDTYYPAPNYKMYSGHTKQARYLQVDTSERIRYRIKFCR